MAFDPKLTKLWIQFLKNNRIVDQESDPKTGRLNYKQKVTADDVIRFLELKTDYTEEQISNAMHMVLAKKAMGGKAKKLDAPKPGTDLSTWMHTQMTPADGPGRGMQTTNPQQRQAGPNQVGNNAPKQLGAPQQKPAQGPTRLRHDPDSVSDIDYVDKPNDPNFHADPNDRPDLRRNKKKGNLKEDFTDDPGYTLDEKEVEEVFTILSGNKSAPQDATTPDQGNKVSPDKVQAKKEADIEHIKEIIMDTMTHSQRLGLWRALNNV